MNRSLDISASPKRLGAGIALTVALAAVTYATYFAGLSGPFVFDDLTSIITNPAVAVSWPSFDAFLVAAGSGESGPGGRPLAYLSFALNHYLAGGFDPFSYKATNVAIHVINSLLVVWLAYRLLVHGVMQAAPPRAYVVAWLSGTLWALHPLHLTSVLYTVQRMTSLSALFVLLGLIAFVWARSRIERAPNRYTVVMGAAVVVGVGFGALAKENAVVMILLAGSAELCLFERRALARKARVNLAVLYAVIIALPGLAGLVALCAWPEVALGGYASRSFDLTERLLTESRVLFHYLGVILVPRLDQLSLVHDDWLVSRGLLLPWTTGLALVGWVAAIGLAILWRRRQPMVTFALAWFLGAHALESSIIPLDLVHEHRNYLASFGCILAIAWYLAAYVSERFGARALALVGLAWLAVFAVTTAVRAAVWGHEGSLTERLVLRHPESASAHGMRAQYLIRVGAPAPQVLDALAEMSQRERRNLAAPLEIARILSAAESVTEPVPARPPSRARPSADDGPRPFTWARPLSLDAVVNEIDRRVAQEPFGGTSVRALADMGRCVLASVPRCERLAEHTERWLQLAVARDLPAKLRAIILVYQGRLAGARNPRLALQHLAAATRADPGNDVLTLEPLNLHVRRRDWSAARAAYARLCPRRLDREAQAELARTLAGLEALGQVLEAPNGDCQ